MLTLEEIKTFMDNDAASTKKQLAKVGVDYYEGNHDILNYRIFFINANGKLQEDKYRSNIKIAHPFFKILADQEAQYILSGNDGIFKSDIPELQAELDTYFNSNDDFNAELYNVIIDSIVKGFGYLHAHKDEEGRTTFQCADSIGVVEVRAKDTVDNCDYIIYWYDDRLGKNNQKIKRIQVWDDKETHFFIQVENGEIQKDPNVEGGKRPHSIFTEKGKVFKDPYGFIPFFRLDNNKKQRSGLYAVKDQIDSYDLMNCGLANNIQDTNEALYVVKGFSGDNLDELMMNIKAKKHIGVDEDGDVEIRTIDIPYEARKIKMEIDEKNIFRFGLGVNTEALKDTSATVSVAIKSAYANLDLKCNGFTIGLKRFLRKPLKVVLDEINKANGTDYRLKDVYFNLEREIITNAQENAQIALTEAQTQQTRITTLLSLATHLGNELLMQNICETLELDYDDLKDKLPNPEGEELDDLQTDLDAAVVEEE